MPLTVQILTSPGCANGPRALELLRALLAELAPDATLEAVTVETLEEARALGFPGSPTVRVDGRDVDPDRPRDIGLG